MEGTGVLDYVDKFFAGLNDATAVLAPVATVGAAVKVGKHQQKVAAAAAAQRKTDMTDAIREGIKGAQQLQGSGLKPAAAQRRAIVGGALIVSMQHLNKHVVPYLKVKAPQGRGPRVAGMKGGAVQALRDHYVDGDKLEDFDQAIAHYKKELSKLSAKRRYEAQKVGHLMHNAAARRKLAAAEEELYVDPEAVASTRQRIKKGLSTLAKLVGAAAVLALAYTQRDALKDKVLGAYNTLRPAAKRRVDQATAAMNEFLVNQGQAAQERMQPPMDTSEDA